MHRKTLARMVKIEGIIHYFGVLRYNQKATALNMMLGVQAATNGGKLPLVAKTVEKRSNSMNSAAITIPRARCMPLPPRFLRLAMVTPIRVNNRTAKGVAVLRYRSTFS